MKPPLRQGRSNDFQTPFSAMEPLLPFLNKNWLIWECACGKGNIVNYLSNQGFFVKGTDILTGQDFINWKPENFDCIITNPPYSLKQGFLKRCYELDKPFALLLPLTTFETEKRQTLFRKYGVEVIMFPYRINFETPSGKGTGAWFSTAWFTNKLNIGKELTFISNRKELSQMQNTS